MGNPNIEAPPRSLTGRILTRRTTNVIRSLLDNWLPPVLRESRLFAWAVALWLGPHALPDFKYRAFRMSPEEFQAAYEGATGGRYAERESDTTPAQADWLVANLGLMPLEVLEIGPGNGSLTKRMRKAGHDVRVVDIHPGDDDHYVQGTVEHIPLADKSVDAIVLAHVIEHVVSLTRAFLELERVARDRVLIVTPKQRFFRWTFDYHLHFFYSVDHLASHAHRGKATGVEIDKDLCLSWDVRPSK